MTVKDNSQQLKITVDQELNRAQNQSGHSDTKSTNKQTEIPKKLSMTREVAYVCLSLTIQII